MICEKSVNTTSTNWQPVVGLTLAWFLGDSESSMHNSKAALQNFINLLILAVFTTLPRSWVYGYGDMVEELKKGNGRYNRPSLDVIRESEKSQNSW